MELTTKMKDDINRIFASDEEIKNKLLAYDADTIREIGIYGSDNFSPDDIISYYEKDDIDNLYKIALKKKEYSELYFELIGNTNGPYNVKYEIDTLFDDEEKTREELLGQDEEMISKMGQYGENGITCLEVIDAYENNKLDELYKKVQKQKMYTELYFEYIYERSTAEDNKVKK